MDAQLRIATSDEDRAAVYGLRYEFYVEDQGLFTDVADHKRRWLTDTYDPHSHIFLAEVDGRVVGTSRLTMCRDVPFTAEARESFDIERFRGVVEERDMAMASRLVVHPAYRGSSLGRELLAKAYELAAVEGVELIFGNSKLHLVNYHHKLGSQTYGNLYNHPTNGVRVRTVVVTGDFKYLRKTASPMLAPLSRRTKPTDAVERILPLLADGPAVRSEKLDDTRSYYDDVFAGLTDEEGVRGILSDLTREEATVLLDKSHLLACRPGDGLIRNGYVSRTLFMLLSGSLEAWDQGRLVARVETPGTVLGEMAFLPAERSRVSDVVAGPSGARTLALCDRNLHDLVANRSLQTAKSLCFIRGMENLSDCGPGLGGPHTYLCPRPLPRNE